jgi:uncharacterized protein YndB with AHSA1/START domain
MATLAPALDHLTLTIVQEIQVRSSPESAFAALLEELGPANQGQDGRPMPMTIEPRPGGRWFRDLGDGNGHFWGHVQAIKRPALLEITGPLFMSYAVVSNVQYRLSENEGGTLIAFRHTVLGLVPDDHREQMGLGWASVLEAVRKRAEGPAKQ